MEQRPAGKADLLTDKGSVYNLVAIFILLLGGDRNLANNIYNGFVNALNNGYTYQFIKQEIFTAFYGNKQFRYNIFNNKRSVDMKNTNLLSFGNVYYHNELKITNNPLEVEMDIDKGTIVSRDKEWYLEPVASYTIQDFIQYFYRTMPIDLQANPPKKMEGMLKYKVNQYGIDKLLFMTDIMATSCKEKDKLFDLGKWDDYSYKADMLMEEIKNTLPVGEDYYKLKERKLFE